MIGSVASPNAPKPRRRARLALAAVCAVLATALCGGLADAVGKYDFRSSPSVGTRTTAFRVGFTAPFGSADGTDYVVQGVGPRACPAFFKITNRRIQRGDRVVMEVKPRDLDARFTSHRRRWCRGAYVGYVYATDAEDHLGKRIGYFRFGVGHRPVSLEP